MRYTIDTVHPEPGDIVLVQYHGEVDFKEANVLAARAKIAFPRNQIILFSDAVSIELLKKTLDERK